MDRDDVSFFFFFFTFPILLHICSQLPLGNRNIRPQTKYIRSPSDENESGAAHAVPTRSSLMGSCLIPTHFLAFFSPLFSPSCSVFRAAGDVFLFPFFPSGSGVEASASAGLLTRTTLSSLSALPPRA